MKGFQTHPREGDEQEVVQEESCRDAEANGVSVESQPGVQQENHVEQKKCQTQVDEDLGWNVSADFAEEIRKRE